MILETPADAATVGSGVARRGFLMRQSPMAAAAPVARV
jgi:hypothetical protein